MRKSARELATPQRIRRMTAFRGGCGSRPFRRRRESRHHDGRASYLRLVDWLWRRPRAGAGRGRLASARRRPGADCDAVDRDPACRLDGAGAALVWAGRRD